MIVFAIMLRYARMFDNDDILAGIISGSIELGIELALISEYFRH